MSKPKKSVNVPGGPAYIFGAKNTAYQPTGASTNSVRNAPPVTASVVDNSESNIPENIRFGNMTFNPYGTTVESGSIEFGEYGNGDIAIEIYDDFEGPYSTATLNLEAYGLRPREGHVFIADYSENEGIWKNLNELGVVSEPVDTVHFGPYDAKAVECKLTAGQNNKNDDTSDGKDYTQIDSYGEYNLNGYHDPDSLKPSDILSKIAGEKGTVKSDDERMTSDVVGSNGEKITMSFSQSSDVMGYARATLYKVDKDDNVVEKKNFSLMHNTPGGYKSESSERSRKRKMNEMLSTADQWVKEIT